MEVVDNFLEEDTFLELQRTIISKHFPVFYQDDVSGIDDKSDTRVINFTHNLYNLSNPSPFYGLVFEKLFSKYNGISNTTAFFFLLFFKNLYIFFLTTG